MLNTTGCGDSIKKGAPVGAPFFCSVFLYLLLVVFRSCLRVWRKVHPSGDNVFRSGVYDMTQMRVGPLGGPDQGLALLWLNIQILLHEFCAATIFDIIQVGHPG